MKKRGEKSYTFEKWGGERERCLLVWNRVAARHRSPLSASLSRRASQLNESVGEGGGRGGGGHFSFLTGRLCIASGLQKGGKGRARAIRGNNKAGRETAGCKGIRAKESLLIHPGKGWLEGGGTTLSDHAEKLSAAGRRNRIASEGNRKVDKVVVGRERAEACWKCARSGRELYIARVCTDRAERIKD